MTGRAALALLALAYLAIALLAVPAPFNIDEVIYALGADAMATRGALTVENGYDTLGPAPALKPLLVNVGPAGLAPQYPSGYFVLAAPFVWAFDLRGLMVLNALAAGACLFLTRALAIRLFADPGLGTAAALILGLASFLPEFAAGLWPHALSVAAVLGAMLAGARAVLGPERGAAGHAALAGLILGLGLQARVDVVLAAPALAAWGLVHARRPLPLAAAGLAGLLPGLALAAGLNWAKFATLSPLSYGRAGGGTDPLSHLWLLPALGLGLAGCWALRRPEVRARAHWLGLAAVAGVAAAALASPAIAGRLAGLADGAAVLLWDVRLSDDTRDGVERLPDGSVLFWGMLKASLGQSLPWLGLLALPLLARAPQAERPGLLLLALAAALWMLPFLLRAWHGGPGSNMRYFLPILPCLAILAAHALRSAARMAEGRAGPARLWLAAGLAGMGAGAVALGGSAGAAAQYEATLGLLSATAAASAGAALAGGRLPGLGAAARGLGWAGLATALVLSALGDLLASQERRLRWQVRETGFAALPERSLVFSVFPFLFQLRRAEGVQAWIVTGNHADPVVDGALVRRAFDRGLRVFVESDRMAALAEAQNPSLRAEPHLAVGLRRVWELLPREDAPAGKGG